MNTRKRFYSIGFFCLLLLGLVFTTETSAATRTWDGGGATNNFSEAANWSDDVAPVSGDEVTFDASSTKNANIDSNISLFRFSIQMGYTGTITQASGVAVEVTFQYTQSSGTFVGGSGAFSFPGAFVAIQSGATFQGGTGLISGNRLSQSGGVFSTGGDIEMVTFDLTGGTFNAPSGLMTVIADYNHTTGGTFNAGTGTVKFTGYNTYNCVNSYSSDVNVTETFYNLEIANSFCNARYIGNGDTLIVTNDLRLSYARIGSGKIRPLGTVTIDATNNGYAGSTVIEYVTPNTNFLINNPSSVVNMLPVEINAANSTLTSSGAGRINFGAMNLINGTVNQGAGIWDMSTNYPGYSQSGGTFNGSAAEVLISNGTGNPLLSGGVFNSGTGKVTGSFRITGGTMSIAGDMDAANLSIEGGIFNAPLGTLSIYQGFSHTLGGTFNARTGTVQTSTAAGVYGVYFDVNATETFNNLKFNGTYNNANHGIALGDAFVVNGTLTFNGRGVSGGSIAANGNVVYSNYGGYQNATTLVKFQDSATRTVTFCNDGSNCGGAYIQPTLVNNPNITINTGVTDNALGVIWQSLDLRQGTVNSTGGGISFYGSVSQSGGAFNGGETSNTFYGDFVLSGGTHNAAPTTTFIGNYTHAAGGAFNYGAGTVIFRGDGGSYNATIDVNGTENFHNIVFSVPNSLYGRNVASGDTITANGNLRIDGGGYVGGGTLEAKRDFSITSAGFSGGSANVLFSGAVNQSFSNNSSNGFGGTWTVNKPNSAPSDADNFAPSAPTSLLVAGVIRGSIDTPYIPLNIVSGSVVETGAYNLVLSSLSISANGSLVNEFGGTMTLAGDVTNDGSIRLNGNGVGCQSDSILIRSNNAVQRNWNGGGIFDLRDADVSGQAGMPIITVYSGTDSGNNGANWIFDANCFAPTSASVSISGRVLNADGRGIARIIVMITDANGNSRSTVTNPFGNYRFSEVSAGQTITVSVRGKKFVFADSVRVLNVSENLAEINFIAEKK